ncbi:MAG: type I DNA topoisomerase [Gemmatimonadetes bacterium]|nr:MAG: type I DNA topoisomerase [Gemmatimonadota bacterium]
MAASKGKNLVIVESPAKARTIGRYLGSGYDVAASVGHVRDLPPKELGVDIEGGFEPQYVTIRGKGKVIQELKRKARNAERIILATDPDREGEAIAYHVAEQLGLDKDADRFQRVTFREITRPAVQRALEEPGPIDMRKVEAQQARRILDRLVGYQVSPFLWKPIRPGLSAGRVQTVALRLICEREDEIRAFTPEEYWSITARLEKDEQAFEAKLHKIDGKAFTLPDEDAARGVLEAVEGVPFRVSEVKRRERRKNPAPPFTTSTLQQEAAKRLRFSARRTMTTAQRLYEGVELPGRGAVGLITYMRTDSTRVSPLAVDEARRWIEREFGESYRPGSPRLWAGRQQRGAQEAHEAIRPTNVDIHPDDVRNVLEPDQARLYELIWLRFVASQMSAAVYDTTTVDFDLAGSDGRRFRFRSTGSVVKFEGFTRLYIEAKEAGDHRRLDDLEPLPALEVDDIARLLGIDPKQHFTQPPPRYSEASLVRELERLGIGRPSTYAQIISTLQDRGYVELEDRRFHPTALGDTVSKLLVKVFPDIFDVEFTSRMEDELDQVEEGEMEWRDVLHDFYPPFRRRLDEGEARSDEIVKEILAAEGETCDRCGRPMLVRWNRFGRFLGCSGYPECRGTRPLDSAGPDEPLGTDPETGLPVYLRNGPYGPYVQLGDAGEDGDKPKRSSLPRGRKPEDVDLEYALKLLSLPRHVGVDPASGEEVVAGLGRFGPFVRKGKTFASLKDETHMFTVTLDEALALLEQKAAGRQVLRELGPHPETGQTLQVLAGRYGPYVTDGKVNASLPKGMEPDELELDEAVELLARAAKRKKRGGGRRGARR